MPFEEDNSIDLVYSIRLLRPTKSRDDALRVVDEMLRITRPGGYMLVGVSERVSAAAWRCSQAIRPIHPARDC